MKKIFFGAFLLLIGSGLYAQDRDLKASEVPSPVQSAFSQKFTHASDVEWEKSKDNYKVSFEVNDRDHKAVFTPSGKLVAQSAEVKGSDVPAAVRSAFAQQFANATDVEWKKTDDRYKASFDVGRTDHKVTFTAGGELVSHSYDIGKNELPASISARVQKDYPDARIDDVAKIDSGGNVSYKVELDGNPDITLWYSAEGELQRKVND